MLAYNDSGNGFPVVLIHGFCESKAVWQYCEPALARQFRVLTPDLPGFGESRLLETNISIDYFADQLKEFLDSLHIEQCVMIGHSLGGYVTLAFAEKYPGMLAGMGLFHSTAFADTDERRENRNKAILFIERYGVPVFAQSFVPPLFSLQNRERLKTEIEALVSDASAASEHGVIETTKAMRDRPERIHVLKKVSFPVLFVAGKQDLSIPLDKTLEQCHLPKHSVVHFLQKAGHMGMIESKHDTIRIIEHFCRLVLQKEESGR
jgi:pimeloyl-ACP methyl ester carboxylesterase